MIGNLRQDAQDTAAQLQSVQAALRQAGAELKDRNRLVLSMIHQLRGRVEQACDPDLD